MISRPAALQDASEQRTGRRISFGYDARDRLTSTVYGDGSTSVTRSYTADGLLYQSNAGGFVWTYGYNNRRLLTLEAYSKPGQSPGQGWNFSWGIDPTVTYANTSRGFNRYAYANSRPYNFVDPNGEDPEAPATIRSIPAPADPKLLGQAIYKLLDTLSQPLQQALNAVIQSASEGPLPPDAKSGSE